MKTARRLILGKTKRGFIARIAAIIIVAVWGAGLPSSGATGNVVQFDGWFDSSVRNFATEGSNAMWGWTQNIYAPLSPVEVAITIDGREVTRLLANRSRPDVAARFPGYGPNSGWEYILDLSQNPGLHLVCAIALWGDLAKTIGCKWATSGHHVLADLKLGYDLAYGEMSLEGTVINADNNGQVLVTLVRVDGNSEVPLGSTLVGGIDTNIPNWNAAYSADHHFERYFGVNDPIGTVYRLYGYSVYGKELIATVVKKP